MVHTRRSPARQLSTSRGRLESTTRGRRRGRKRKSTRGSGSEKREGRDKQKGTGDEEVAEVGDVDKNVGKRKLRRVTRARTARGKQKSQDKYQDKHDGNENEEMIGVEDVAEATGRSSKDEKVEKDIEDSNDAREVIIGWSENDKDCDHGIGYFEAHAGAVKTSNFTLCDLHIESEESLRRGEEKILSEMQKERTSLENLYRAQFHRWYYLLRAGFSLLVYGFGSKRKLLNAFAEFVNEDAETLDDLQVMIVCGYSPMLSLQSILSMITDDYLRIRKFPRRTPFDYVDAIRNYTLRQQELQDERKGKERRGRLSKRLILVIHNIDGSALRSTNIQAVLCSLSRIPHVHLVASVDHANAPLLWDTATHAAFCWSWVECTTFQPYDVETAFCTAPVLHKGDEVRVKAAVVLLRSLTAKARKVFRLMAQPIASKDSGANNDFCNGYGRPHAAKTEGTMTFNALFEQCRQKFFVSNPADLRSILTELKTHDLLESRVGVDAAQLLWLPLSPAQAKAILKELSSET